MNWMNYRNELVVAAAFVLMLAAFGYKEAKVGGQADAAVQGSKAVSEIKEVIALKEIWGNKNLSKKVDVLKTVVSASQVSWNKKSKKLTARYSGLSNSEVNRLGKKVMNLAVVIEKLEVSKKGDLFDVELQCKW